MSLKGREIKKEVLNLIPGPVAGTHGVVAFDRDKTEVKLAMADPTDIQTIEFLRRKTGLEPKVYVTAPSDLKEALRRYHAELEDDLRVIQDASGGEAAPSDLKKPPRNCRSLISSIRFWNTPFTKTLRIFILNRRKKKSSSVIALTAF